MRNLKFLRSMIVICDSLNDDNERARFSKSHPQAAADLISSHNANNAMSAMDETVNVKIVAFTFLVASMLELLWHSRSRCFAFYASPEKYILRHLKL